MLRALGEAFEGNAQSATTLKDVGLVERRLGGLHFGGGPSTAPAAVGALLPTALSLQAGSVYVHAKRPEEPVPTFGMLARTGVATVDATFHRRSQQLMQEMAREFSDFSL